MNEIIKMNFNCKSNKKENLTFYETTHGMDMDIIFCLL